MTSASLPQMVKLLLGLARRRGLLTSEVRDAGGVRPRRGLWVVGFLVPFTGQVEESLRQAARKPKIERSFQSQKVYLKSWDYAACLGSSVDLSQRLRPPSTSP